MFHVLVTANESLVKNKACLDRNGTVFFPTDAMNTLAHYGGMFDYFKGTCASYTLPTHLNVKSDGCLQIPTFQLWFVDVSLEQIKHFSTKRLDH